MPRFVILEHDHPFLHWDLMLESGDVLRTWRLAAAPAPGLCVAAEAIGDHRRAYLDYEGPVSGNRGHVQQWDRGSFDGELPAAFTVGQAAELHLHGQRLRGPAVLQREDSDRWSFRPLS